LDTDARDRLFPSDAPAAGSVVAVGEEPLQVAGELRQLPHLGMGHVQILAEHDQTVRAQRCSGTRGRDQREIAQRDPTDLRLRDTRGEQRLHVAGTRRGHSARRSPWRLASIRSR
jgi:hypothetical protein